MALLDKISALRNWQKSFVAVLYDLFGCALAYYLALALRHESINLFQIPTESYYFNMFIVLIAQGITFKVAGLYKGIWRFSSTPDLIRVIKAAFVAVILSLLFLFVFNRLLFIPRSFFILDFILLVLILGGGRFLFRIWVDSFDLKFMMSHSQSALIIGAGRSGEQIFREMRQNKYLDTRVLGFIDKYKYLKGKFIHNIPVLGTLEDLRAICEENNITKLIVAIPTINSSAIREIAKLVQGLNIEIKVLPQVSKNLDNEARVSLLRNLNVEDLLGREVVNLSIEHITSMLKDKVILISGAGGSIGSELCRQVIQFNPKLLIILDLSEFNLYRMDLELRSKYPNQNIISTVGDVRNPKKVEQIISTYKPETIFHAAAYKHVPIMENDPYEAVQVNVVGTKILAETAAKNHVKKFVFVSTDKAVNPTNIMGASKRIAELVCQNIQNNYPETDFSIVRFGNVLGSSGSVIPLFKEQIDHGGPVTVTHKDVKRYFMSIPEACQLILQSGSMQSSGNIHILEMGEPVRIIELAEEMIRLAGKKPYEEIDIEVTGLRPGEKLYEELSNLSEQSIATDHPKVRSIKTHFEIEGFNGNIDQLISLGPKDEIGSYIFIIRKLVSEYKTASEHYLEHNGNVSLQ